MKCLNTINTNTTVRSDIPVVLKKNTEVCGDRFELSNSDKGIKDLQKDLKLLDQVKSQINHEVDLQDIDENEEVTIYGAMPTPGELEEAMRMASSATEPGNPPDFEGVVKFKELFDSGQVKPGDIILIAKPSRGSFHPLSTLVPGEYSHVAVYLGKNEKGGHESIDAWSSPKTPVRDVMWWPESYNNWCVIRPHKPDGTELTDEERSKAVAFAREAEGCKYNYMWPKNKVKLPVNKEKTKFYCSQLAWASYNFTLGINLDANPGFHPKFAWGVAPQELFDSPNVTVVAKYNRPKSADYDPTPDNPTVV